MKVAELFAGVGGFRLGLERASEEFITVFANQWEPNKKKQWAYENYISHWDNCVCEDITKIDKNSLPDFDLLVGGFPCQPFSKARSADKALGLEDEQKGILWWQIREILEKKNPKYVLLENVDRLLKSPTKQRGRDFGVILKGFSDLGYTVEWRVINAADYGNAQRRRRTYILAYKGKYKNCLNECFPLDEIDNQIKETRVYILCKTETEVFNTFKADFGSVGYCENGNIKTKDVIPKFEQPTSLAEILISVERERERESIQQGILRMNKLKSLNILKVVREYRELRKTVMNGFIQRVQWLFPMTWINRVGQCLQVRVV